MNDHDQQDDWIARAKQGDQEAFEQLVHLYEKRVFALTHRMCKNPEDAAEAAQEAFLSAWQGLPFFRGDSSFSTWIYRLASNACVDLLRREGRHSGAAGPSFDDASVQLDVSDKGADPQKSLEQSEIRDSINRGLELLSPQHREVLILREMHQRSYDEISEILDLDVGTVKSRLNRGRKQLQKYLKQFGNFLPTATSKHSEKGE